MFNIVGKRKWYFLASGVLIGLGLIAMALSLVQYGSLVRLSVDFTGGAMLEVLFDKPVRPREVRQVFVDRGYGDTAVQTTAD